MNNKAPFFLFLIIFTLASGTAGYSIIEGWTILDSLYMTVITITTVGFGEVRKLSPEGRMFTVVLILFSIGTVFYILNNGAKVLIEGGLADLYGRRRLKQKIKSLKDHYIVCGFGRMGRIITEELDSNRVSYVVIEKHGESSELACSSLECPYLVADATRDESLIEAGIERARGLISVLPTDAENLYVVLSARGLNQNLKIVARASEEGSEQKLMRAGADKVVSPYHIGGMRIAHMVLKPVMLDFIEFATKSDNMFLSMEEITITEQSRLNGLSLAESGIGREFGVIVVAIKDLDENMRFNPPHNMLLRPGSVLIALGEDTKLRKLEAVASIGMVRV